MKIAITGATGQLGQLVVDSLLKHQDASNLVLLVRDVTKAKHYQDKGAVVKAFDYDQPEQLSESLNGVDRLLLISGSEVGRRVVQHQHVIDAAKKAGVQHVIYTSVLHADQSTLGLAQEHRETEALIQKSGLTYTILRNGWYTENYTQSVPQVIEHGALYGAANNGKISSATRLDYAEAAANVLSSNGHENKIYELAGSSSYTLTDLAETLSTITGKEITYENLPADAYSKLLLDIGLPQFVVDVVVDADVQASQGALYSESKDLEVLLERKTTSLNDVLSAYSN